MYIVFTHLGPVHTHPDIFESAAFSSWIQKFLRPHVSGFVIADLSFSTLKSGFKNIRIRRIACGRKPCPEKKKKIGIKKYPDTYGHGPSVGNLILGLLAISPASVLCLTLNTNMKGKK